MTEQSKVRQHVVVAASAMLARHGLKATSIRETLERAKSLFIISRARAKQGATTIGGNSQGLARRVSASESKG